MFKPYLTLAVLFLYLFLLGRAWAEPNAIPEFEACVTAIGHRAVQDGISQSTVTEVLGGVEQLERVIQADRKQPEFTQTFYDYYRIRVTQSRIEKGRELGNQHLTLLKQVSQQHGVPWQYLVAFWGLETNFGRYFGKLHIPSALATLACDTRRAEFFTQQLLATLKIVDAGHMNIEQLTGSWAGAMGHMQFMPTTYLEHARDGDGDGKADLRGSLVDAFHSAAAYLKAIGWQSGYRWGREVILPDGFDFALAGRHQPQPLGTWRKLGVTSVSGSQLPDVDLSAALLLPSGQFGPAFLVYGNFDIIMKWNRSEFYALSVGILADRIAGAGRLTTPIPTTKVSTADLVAVQNELIKLEFLDGDADGVLGPATRGAIVKYQQKHNLPADGFPDPKVIEHLLAPTDGEQ